MPDHSDSTNAPTPTTTPASAAPSVSGRERFLRACHCQPGSGTPVWLMRQAGRVLPEYRALKEQHTFLELVHTPELAVEVTMQPVRRFGFDAAIIFSDILVIPEALGQGYRFRDEGGIQMDFTITEAAQIDALAPASAIPERLDYVSDALMLARLELTGKTALIGFTGSPWTLANFMLEGGSSANFSKALALFRQDRALFDRLCERLTEAIIRYLRMQITARVDAIQIFDTLGGLLPAELWEEASGRWLRRIVEALFDTVPVIVFSKGARVPLDTLAGTRAQVLGFDPATDLGDVRRALSPRIAIQGNLDPAILETTPDQVARETRRILELMRGRAGHIFNLGHGVPPGASLENVAVLVETVRNFA